MRERLGDEDAGGGRPLAAHAAERLGDADERDAELGDRALEDRLRRGALGVGRGGRRAQLLGGELARRVDDHLLLVGGGEVEQAACRPRSLGRSACRRRCAAANVRFATPTVRKPVRAPW